MRDENQRLQSQLEDLSKIEKENKELANELTDMQLAASSSEKKLKLLEEDLDQARVVAQVSHFFQLAKFHVLML